MMVAEIAEKKWEIAVGRVNLTKHRRRLGLRPISTVERVAR